MAPKKIALGLMLNLLEGSILYLLLRISWILFVEQGWGYQKVEVPVPAIRFTQCIPSAFQFAAEVLPSHVSPWAVEHLPNPVIFSAMFAVYAGYNVVQMTLKTNNQGGAGDHKLENIGDRHVVDTPSQRCIDCDQAFRRRGLLTRHINRKHVRRFRCEVCQSAFHLKKDLDRHMITVHRQNGESSRGYECANMHYITPGTSFVRKDNFRRHLQRCARREHHRLDNHARAANSGTSTSPFT